MESRHPLDAAHFRRPLDRPCGSATPDMHQGHTLVLAIFGEFLRATTQDKRVFPVQGEREMLYAQFVERVHEPSARACDGIRYASGRQRGGDFKRAAFNAALFERRKNL